MANQNLADEQQRQEQELLSYLESIETAKWNIWRDAKFVYDLDIEFHDFVYEADKFFKSLGETK